MTNRLVSYYVLGMLTVVDRAWRKGLQDLIPSKDNQITVYHHLRVLLQETEEAQFRVTLQEFLTYIKEKHKRFYSYFNVLD